jgi:hypothetical protein
MDTYNNTASLREGVSERRDCTVIALAAVTGLPYSRCHAAMKAVGRKDRKGVPFRRVAQQVAREVGYSFVQVCRSGTLGKFVQNHPHGAFYVTIRGHALAVRDGVIHDCVRPRLGSHVRRAWRVDPPTPQKINLDRKMGVGYITHAQSKSININHTYIPTMTFGDSAAIHRSIVTSSKPAVKTGGKKTRASKSSGVTNRAYSKKLALKLADECGKWWIKGRCRKEFLDQFEERCREVLATMVKAQTCKGKSLRAI